MRFNQPYPDVPGDNNEHLMSRDGSLVGFDRYHAVWRFGYMPGSVHAEAHGISIEQDSMQHGFLWVLTTVRTSRIVDTYRGFALNLPENFRTVIDQPRASVLGR